MFEFFNNELISSNQSDSCISQLLRITHDIYQSLGDGLETRAVFLAISKAFDEVWHEGLLYKLTQNGKSRNLINIIKDFLSLRKERVVLKRLHSTWVDINSEVPQVSFLEPLSFLTHINDISDASNSNPKLFTGYTSLFSVVQNVNSTTTNLNSDLRKQVIGLSNGK